MFKMRWLGNAGYELKLGQQTLLIDPFLTRPRRMRVYFGRVSPDIDAIHEYIGHCDQILVSHTHFDHFMDVPEIAQRTGAVVYGSRNTCELATRLGVPHKHTFMVHANENFQLRDIEVNVIPAAHPWIPGYTAGKLRKRTGSPLHLRDYRMDECFSFLIKYQDKRLLVWSSTRTDGTVSADVLICRAVSGRRWYGRMMEAVQPRIVIPSHWDDMFEPLSEPVRPFLSPPRLAWPPVERIDLKRFERKVMEARPGCRVAVPERFEDIRIEV